jgi:hypothetical protein
MLKSFLEKTLESEDVRRRTSRNSTGTAKAPVGIEGDGEDDSVNLVKYIGSAPNSKDRLIQSKKRAYEDYGGDDDEMLGSHAASSWKRSRIEGGGMIAMGLQSDAGLGLHKHLDESGRPVSFDNLERFHIKDQHQYHQSGDMGGVALGISGLGLPNGAPQSPFGSHQYHQSINPVLGGNGFDDGPQVAYLQHSSAGMGGVGLDDFGLSLANGYEQKAFGAYKYHNAGLGGNISYDGPSVAYQQHPSTGVGDVADDDFGLPLEFHNDSTAFGDPEQPA